MAEDGELTPIAIVGMSCRLPGDISTTNDFWKLMTKGRSTWSPIPKNRFNAAAYHHPNPERKGTFNSLGGYFLSQDLEMFDAGFFDMTKKEAETMGSCSSAGFTLKYPGIHTNQPSPRSHTACPSGMQLRSSRERWHSQGEHRRQEGWGVHRSAGYGAQDGQPSGPGRCSHV